MRMLSCLPSEGKPMSDDPLGALILDCAPRVPAEVTDDDARDDWWDALACCWLRQQYDALCALAALRDTLHGWEYPR